jgi:glycosyltransferase involved in cell wall biosynthesis
LKVNYRANDYGYAERHPDELACIIGGPYVLDKLSWKNPILFGAAVHSHPVADPDLLERLPIQKVLVPGEWMRQMCEPFWGANVAAWPVGIDTDRWRPLTADYEARGGSDEKLKAEIGKVAKERTTDFLIYDKVRWEHEAFERSLIQPVSDELKRRGLSFREIRYGFYEEEEFENQLASCKAMIFLCEHETQGIAYQQALACDVPILAWDRSGFWQDPAYYPRKVKFSPVSSVPYWDERCGMKFEAASDFPAAMDEFWNRVQAGRFAPRDYILENLTLEKCARKYLDIVTSLSTKSQ